MKSDYPFLLPLLTYRHQLLFFSFSSETENWHSTRAEVSKISIITLMDRCEFILSRFLVDEKNLGEGSPFSDKP